MSDKGQRALELRKQWLEEDGDPWLPPYGIDEYRKKMGPDSLIILDEITGYYKEFIDWNELIDWCMRRITP